MEKNIDFERIKEETGLSGEEFFQLLLDTLSVEVFAKNTDGTYLYVNEIQCKNDGVHRSEVIGKRDQDYLEEDLCSIYSETDKEVLMYDKELSFTSDSLNAKNLKTYKRPFRKEDGTLIGIAGYSYDSTKTVNELNKLNMELSRFEGVFNNSPLGIGIYDSTFGAPIEINDTYSEITGRTREELITLPWEAYSYPSEIQENQQYLKLMVEGKINGFNMEKRYVKPDGSIVWVHMTVTRYKNEFNRDSHLVMIMDITARKEAEAKAKYYYDHDAMTDLYNRKYGDEKLLELDKLEYLPLSIIVADANGLKVTNDAFGHMEGDRVIKKLADIFLKYIRPEDYVVRTGGDEFMVILPNTLETEALDLVKKIKQRFEVDLEDAFLLSMAMGCATKTSTEESIEHVYQSAEARMYRNKIQDGDAHKNKTIEFLQEKLEKQTSGMKEHCLNVKKYSMALAKAMGLNEGTQLELGLAGYYHDIGKVGLDIDIINKREDLDQRDWINVMKHPEIGYQILKSVPDYGRIADYVLYHHERVDGVGYPTSSSSKKISLPAKILALAEAYSDMTMDRLYKDKLTKEEAIMEIKNGAGTQFDENLVNIFIDKVLREDEAL